MSQELSNTVLSSEEFSSFKWKCFWREAFALRGSITPHVIPNVLFVGLFAGLLCVASVIAESHFGVTLALPLAPYEFIGAALGLLLVLRTNAGYDRWWEARKLWGGLVNQCRNLGITGLAYGPADEIWRGNFVRMIAAFPHAARLTLRNQTSSESVQNLVGPELARELVTSQHIPSTVAYKLGLLLREACEKHGMDRFYWLQADRERAQLIDHLGACERILKTPLALAYSIKIRRFIASFMLTLPFALMHSLENIVLVPFIAMLVAYPLFSLDQLGVELQNPFNTEHLSHLPLDEICQTIESNLLNLPGESSLVSSPDSHDWVSQMPKTLLGSGSGNGEA